MLTVLKSENRKTGPIATTYRGKQSCPTECPQFKTCYAKFGCTNIQFDLAGKKQIDREAVLIGKFIRSLPPAHKLRHFVAGDLLKDGKIDRVFIKSMIRAHIRRQDLKGWGYTHAWARFKKNPFANIESLTISASCENGKQIKQARKKGFDTVITVPENTPSGLSIYQQEKILVCLSQVHEDITCEKCMICFKKNRTFSVAFRAHGVAKKKIDWAAFDL